MKFRNVTPKVAIFFYALIALEVIIMITPFAVYFYSFYAPILNILDSTPITSWLTAFFLPHIALTNNFFLLFLSFFGPALFFIGLGTFFICASQVYYVKLAKKGVVTRGLYSSIRHPQYLGLAISGMGLVLFWPRFIILALYVSMIFVYYLLAKNEEERMERAYPEAYREYVSKTPSMFLPLKLEKFLHKAPESWKSASALFVIYLIVLAGAFGVGFGLREYAKSQVPIIYKDNIAAISLTPIDKAKMERNLEIALADEKIASRLSKENTYVIYMLPSDYMMQHIIVENPMTESHEEHHGTEAGLAPTLTHLKDMFILTPQSQLQGVPDRMIFTMVEGQLTPEEALGINVKRIPFLLADIDLSRNKVSLVMETAQRHAWGTIPMPIF